MMYMVPRGLGRGRQCSQEIRGFPDRPVSCGSRLQLWEIFLAAEYDHKTHLIGFVGRSHDVMCGMHDAEYTAMD